MKFREYVGEGKRRRIKEIVTPIETGNVVDTYLGFGLSKNRLKRVFDYLKSWYIRYNIPFESLNPYLTILKIGNLEWNRGKIIKEVKEAMAFPHQRYFQNGRIVIIRENKDFVAIEYDPNIGFIGDMKQVFKDAEILEEMSYVKLIAMKKGIFSDDLFMDMLNNVPPIPKIDPPMSIGLLRRKRFYGRI